MPPLKFILALTLIVAPVVVVIWLLFMKINPAVTLLTLRAAPPPPICELMYALIALCVGTTLSESAVKNGSVENSVMLAELPPSVTSPSVNSCSPEILNASAFNVATPVDCSMLNRSPTLKLPSWSVDVKNTLPPCFQ